MNFEEGLGVVPRRRARRCIVREGSKLTGEKRGVKRLNCWKAKPKPTKRTYVAETKE